MKLKWNKELDNKIKIFISEGKKHKEIALIIGCTEKAISLRCWRLNLKIVSKKDFICLNCGKIVQDYFTIDRRFCTRRCAGLFNSPNRKSSEETKNKISKGLIRYYSDKKKEKINKEPKIIKCKNCENITRNNKAFICEICRYQYYKFYKPSCNFKFSLNTFPEEFDFSLIDKYGWYKPKNRGDNLCGVSRDHMYSVKDGFVNNIDPLIIAHPANCRLVLHSENSSKNSQSLITIEELMIRIKNWNEKYK